MPGIRDAAHFPGSKKAHTAFFKFTPGTMVYSGGRFKLTMQKSRPSDIFNHAIGSAWLVRLLFFIHHYNQREKEREHA
ncbi:MAG: hypothetical protein A2078_15105 [Nitrospirae bacterium GWC2_57_9]|nr:MAG: hypothetical protein A2078_15105 [Nitrospirae bacterium GWC2_57_9]